MLTPSDLATSAGGHSLTTSRSKIWYCFKLNFPFTRSNAAVSRPRRHSFSKSSSRSVAFGSATRWTVAVREVLSDEGGDFWTGLGGGLLIEAACWRFLSWSLMRQEVKLRSQVLKRQIFGP